MKRFLLVFMCFYFVSGSQVIYAQKIKRWNGKGPEWQNDTLKLTTEHHFLKKFGWSFPDIKSKPIGFNEQGNATFFWNNLPVFLHQSGESLSLEYNGTKYFSEKKTSANELYIDREKLPKITVTSDVLTPYSTWVTQSVPVTQYREEWYYVYDAQFKTTYRVCKHIPYTTYEYRNVLVNVIKKEKQTYQQPYIPAYSYYEFVLPTGTLLVYQTAPDTYFIQNGSFLSAENKGGLQYILMDKDADGIYNGSEDMIMLHKNGNDKRENSPADIPGFSTNQWYLLEEIEKEFLTSVTVSSHQLLVVNQNSKYHHSHETGSICFNNLLRGSLVYVNGKAGHFKPGKKYTCPFGFYRLSITRPGSRPLVLNMEVNAQHPQLEIDCRIKKNEAGVVIKNICCDYSVWLENEAAAFQKGFVNEPTMRVPAGKIKVTMKAGGKNIIRFYEVKEGEVLLIDFTEELGKEAE
ncbi:MAG: hypothetical protein K1X81_01095 [Bacteroidia bacterium]|nr:hypothetical protein [Bacteroidia bacterium]